MKHSHLGFAEFRTATHKTLYTIFFLNLPTFIPIDRNSNKERKVVHKRTQERADVVTRTSASFSSTCFEQGNIRFLDFAELRRKFPAKIKESPPLVLHFAKIPPFYDQKSVHVAWDFDHSTHWSVNQIPEPFVHLVFWFRSTSKTTLC